MTDKITLGSFASFQNDATAVALINANNALITTAIDNTLSRDGTSPNTMGASLDMNSNQILNLPAPSTNSSPVRLQDLTPGSIPVVTLSSLAFLRIVVKGINFNSANTDTPVTITLPLGVTRFLANTIRITNASASISTATIGVFTGTGGTGQTIAANQAITVTSTAADTINNAQSLSITNGGTEAYNDTTIQIRIGTAQGSAATADVVITIVPLT